MPVEHQQAKHETVMDVTGEQIARVYAQAFMRAAAKSPDATGLVEQIASLVDVLDRVPQLDKILRSALIAHDEKEQLVDRIFAKRASPLVLNFLKVLSARGRLELLRAIARLVEKLDRQR